MCSQSFVVKLSTLYFKKGCEFVDYFLRRSSTSQVRKNFGMRRRKPVRVPILLVVIMSNYELMTSYEYHKWSLKQWPWMRQQVVFVDVMSHLLSIFAGLARCPPWIAAWRRRANEVWEVLEVEQLNSELSSGGSSFSRAQLTPLGLAEQLKNRSHHMSKLLLLLPTPHPQEIQFRKKSEVQQH